MNTRMIVPAILSAVMLSTPVLAAGGHGAGTPSYRPIQTVATMTPGEKCTALEKQLDEAIKTHGTSAKVNEAKTLRTEGGNLCYGGKQTDGIAKLEKALKDLGVKVKS